MNAVEARDLHFSYGDLQIFRGLSLDIPRGKVVAILGSSGSGKSTLLKLIGGQLRPSRGSITVGGRNVHQLSSDELYKLRLEMGMMFQTSGLFTDLSVYENIAFPIRENFDVPEDVVRRMVLMKLHAVGLRGARDMMPGDLSGGMARRVALARAVATDPKLLMYDEPFAGLDPISLNHIAVLIRELNASLGLTSIVVTYDVKEALGVCDYVYVICDGVVLGHGTPDQVARADDPYLKQFLNALPDGPVRFHFPGPELQEDLNLSAVLRDKAWRHAVVAPALARRLRAVVEEMAVVPAAARAVVLGARIDQEVILLRLERARDAGEEARPAGSGLVLHGRSEQGQPAAQAGEHAGALLVVERARAGALGAFVAQHLVGLGRQALLPLLLGELERLARRGHAQPGGQQRLPVLLQLLDGLHAGRRRRERAERRRRKCHKKSASFHAVLIGSLRCGLVVPADRS